MIVLEYSLTFRLLESEFKETICSGVFFPSAICRATRRFVRSFWTGWFFCLRQAPLAKPGGGVNKLEHNIFSSSPKQIIRHQTDEIGIRGCGC